MSADIREAKQRLSLPTLMYRLGVGEHAKKSARCPFHDDKHNSFSVWKNGAGLWFWKCHSGCGEGDEITFLEKHRNVSNNVATKLFLELAGGNGAALSAPNQASAARSTSPLDWRACVLAFTENQIEQLANGRGYSIEFCSWPKENGLVGFYDGCIAFPVRDHVDKVVAVHYRLKDGSWRYYPQGAKVRPLIIGQLLPNEPVHIFESYFDAFSFMNKSGERTGVIVTRGARNGALVAGLIPAGTTVYAWKQNDELKNGKRAGDEWLKDVAAHAERKVLWPKTPQQFKDLNDWTRAGATVDDLLAAMKNAEVVFEPEKSWIDALNESVVTSSELRDLNLVPRKKLLGDWFSEGDLGFIFAFRGVGKTWLALGIAQALSTGGKLGDWPAHAPVNVLYIDGEMPPDLMRGRSEGLHASNGNLHFLNHEILFERAGRVLNIANPEMQQAITARCVTSGIKALILDNLSTLASGVRENEADSWEQVNHWLLDLRRRKIAVVIVHHAGRSGEMRGTSKREDNVFWIIALDDAKQNADDKRGARFISRFTKPSRNTQEEVPAYEWHFVTETSGTVSISHKLAESLQVFRKWIEDGVTDCSQLAEEMKVSKGTISKWAAKGFREGWLKKDGRDYALVQRADGNEEL